MNRFPVVSLQENLTLQHLPYERNVIGEYGVSLLKEVKESHVDTCLLPPSTNGFPVVSPPNGLGCVDQDSIFALAAVTPKVDLEREAF